MWSPTPLATVGETIRLAVAPVFLLTGIATMLAVMTGRLARIIGRGRELSHALKNSEALDATQWKELDLIPRRIFVINLAILLSVAAALSVCLVIALLFVSNLVHLPMGTVVAIIFILAMGLMMGGMIGFLIEVRLTLNLYYIDVATLARSARKP